MADRTINFGSDENEATYQIQDDSSAGGGNFVINDTDASIALFEYDQQADRWSLAGIDINDADVTTLAATDATVATLNGADVSGASLGNVIASDGNGDLEFTFALTEAGHGLRLDTTTVNMARRVPV